MSQSGYTPLKIYSSSTASNVPNASNLTNDLAGSELAINIVDGKLYFKNNAGVVTLLASNSATTGVYPYLSTSGTTSTTPVLSFNASNSNFASGATVAGSYLQNVIQNKSGTAGASTNYVVSNNLGTDSSYYGEFGMNSSNYSSGTPTDFFSINNGIYFSGHDGDITIGSGNGYKLFLAWGTSGQSAHVINASGAIGLNTSITGSTNFGTAGQVLTSGGTSATPTWTTPVTGTVTSVGATVPSFLSIAGSPITTSGTLAIGYSGTALPVANGGTGLTATPNYGEIDIGNGTGFTRTTITAGPNISINNSAGAILISTIGAGAPLDETDIGTNANQIPINQYLGTMAWQDANSVQIAGGNANLSLLNMNGLMYPQQAPTASAPAYVKGAIYFDTTLNKLRVGGATAWETITSV
jgi:hypothetical protein